MLQAFARNTFQLDPDPDFEAPHFVNNMMSQGAALIDGGIVTVAVYS